MPEVRSRLIVGTLAGMRIAIRVAFVVARDRLNRVSDDTLMTRSFAVREVVLGVGGLLAAARADITPSAIRTWAGLGALTDAGDLVTSMLGARRRSSQLMPALVAAGGLVTELWAFAGNGAALELGIGTGRNHQPFTSSSTTHISVWEKLA
jgi:hypothetical protein